jgi:hypothetical protein
MATARGRRIPLARRGGGDVRGDGADRHDPLPRPNVIAVEGDDDPALVTGEGIRGLMMDPISAGVGGYRRYVSDDQGIAAARCVLDEAGPDQFLVNLLDLLRRSFGCLEWGGGRLPPERN